MRPVLLLSLVVVGFSSCSLPPVNLSTPEPIKVDVSMRLDVYQYRGDEPKKVDQAKVAYEEAIDRQRNRMAEIQTIKNNGLVGEEHRGLLYLREKPSGEWGEYTERTIRSENEDRTMIMRYLAKDSNRALHEVQREQWELRVAKAFEGEWIEVYGDKPNTYVWKQASKSIAVNASMTKTSLPSP